MTVISVLCRADTHLHLAPKQTGYGVSVHTLCLQKWAKREPCREDSEFCVECLEKFKQQEHTQCEQED